MDYKVLITTSGTGSRLGELTKQTNKALIPINGKATIDYLLEKYPNEIPVVITLGYLGKQVKEYLLKNYSDRKFEFAEVDKFEGHGSSLGYSLLCAKEYVQCPFIYHACDTIVVEPIPAPIKNWIAGFVVDENNSEMGIKQYRTHEVKDNKIITLKDKGVPGFQSIHIGLDGIFDYKIFWETLEKLYTNDPQNTGLSAILVL